MPKCQYRGRKAHVSVVWSVKIFVWLFVDSSNIHPCTPCLRPTLILRFIPSKSHNHSQLYLTIRATVILRHRHIFFSVCYRYNNGIDYGVSWYREPPRPAASTLLHGPGRVCGCVLRLHPRLNTAVFWGAFLHQAWQWRSLPYPRELFIRIVVLGGRGWSAQPRETQGRRVC